MTGTKKKFFFGGTCLACFVLLVRNGEDTSSAKCGWTTRGIADWNHATDLLKQHSRSKCQLTTRGIVDRNHATELLKQHSRSKYRWTTRGIVDRNHATELLKQHSRSKCG